MLGEDVEDLAARRDVERDTPAGQDDVERLAVEELSGHDLSVRSDRFNLQMATRAWQVLRALDRLG